MIQFQRADSFFFPEIIFWKMILGESMRAKGKDFAWEKKGINLEICHFIFEVANFKKWLTLKSAE